ncbi:MAG: N(G),N(G)-dimethylarginine dimethylaminohydrolase, partial [Actinobacteria bacterium]|nr:N(G),N(G)-dimethylarginine dimethylaminohydrolase [Actinomycetota bacterium]
MSSRPIALVRRPSPLLEQGLVTHIERTPVDVELALKQWSNYVEALRLCKWSIIEVPAIDECPDGVFIEDTVVIYKGVAIIT